MWPLILVAVGLLVLLWFLRWIGLFYDPLVWTGKPPFMGSFKIAYVYGRGHYRNVAPVFEELRRLVTDPNANFVGIYYDDPKTTQESQLRWAVGLVIEINGQPVVNDYVLQLLLTKKYKLASMPGIDKAIRSEFPFNSSLSVLVAVWKVYAKIRNFAKESSLVGYPGLEFYYGKKIHFVMPLTNNEEFFVEETK